MALFTLNYTGHEASSGELDFYDASKAMLGFQRSLALTAHLVQNGDIITQATALKNGRILVRPPQEGSWEIIAGVVFAATGGMALASRDSAAGRFTRRVYDYVLKSVEGGDVNFEEEFGKEFESQLNSKQITESKLDSLIEKAEPAIIDMHRPIVWSETAQRGRVYFDGSRDKRVGLALSPETYEYATQTHEISLPILFSGKVSSYNSNTYKGRIFLPAEGRPVPFELSEQIRNRRTVEMVTTSLRTNAMDRSNQSALIGVRAFRRESSTGRLKSLWIVEVASEASALSH